MNKLVSLVRAQVGPHQSENPHHPVWVFSFSETKLGIPWLLFGNERKDSHMRIEVFYLQEWTFSGP